MGSENDGASRNFQSSLPPAVDPAADLLDSPGDEKSDHQKKNAATGASAAGVRAVSARLIAYYFRAPVKSFFRTRVEYVCPNKSYTASIPAANSARFTLVTW